MEWLILLVTLVLGWFVIYTATRAAMKSALRDHSVWSRDGGLDEALTQRKAVIEQWKGNPE